MEKTKGSVWKKIDARWTPQLHAASYYLNPQWWYEDKFSNVDELRKGLHECMEKM